MHTGPNSSKTASKKVVHKTGEFADAVTNWYDGKILKTKPVEEIIIPPEKKNELRQVL